MSGRMRKRDEILDDIQLGTRSELRLLLEIMLDIRDLLMLLFDKFSLKNFIGLK